MLRQNARRASVGLLMILALFILAVGLLLGALAIALQAWAILHPPRMTDAKAALLLKRLSPGDLGMAFEPVSLTVRDHRNGRPLDIAAWWVPHPVGGGKCVVLVHGYADAKVGAIAWAPVWQSLGFHILAIDLRAHGESGGTCTTGGFLERHDLDQVLNQLRAARPQQTQRVVLFGIGLGAAVVLATAELRDDIAALVLESPFADYRSAVQSHAQALGLPLPCLLPISLCVAQRLSGADFGAVRPGQLIAAAKCPVMVIRSGDDSFVSSPGVEPMAIEVIGRANGSVYWRVVGVPPFQAVVANPQEYCRRIEQFLKDKATV